MFSRSKVFLACIMLMFTAIFLSGCSGAGDSASSEKAVATLDTSNGGIADGATNVSKTPTIVLKFDTPIDPATMNSETVKLAPSTDTKKNCRT